MEVVDAATLSEKEWGGLLLPAPYSELLGEPDPAMTLI